MTNICVVGAGHVGLVTSACFAELGNNVVCMDDDIRKIEGLKKSVLPFYEPGLEVMVLQNMKAGRLSFTCSLEESIGKSDIIFIAVGTPQKSNGEADLTSVENVASRIACAINGYKLIVEKSTVPIKTGDWISKTIKLNCKKGIEFDIASNPEFLREGAAIHDFMQPDRIVIGVGTEKAAKLLTEIYKPIHSPLVITDVKTAELIKHASNSFLALKISYINAVSNICDRTGADVLKVAEGMGFDKRIGKDFLCAGVGYGGYCFPKDISAFIRMAEEVGYDFELLKAVQKINDYQRQLIVKKVKDALWNLKGKTACILGLSFKPNTDDMRESPSIYIIGELQKQGVLIKVYDPQAMEAAKAFLQDVEYCQNPYEAAKDSDVLILVTEWDEFKNLDFTKIKKLLKQPIIIDGRNIFDPATMKEHGLIYSGIGR
jgi:UDPglucose 6-dehydrogenase